MIKWIDNLGNEYERRYLAVAQQRFDEAYLKKYEDAHIQVDDKLADQSPLGAKASEGYYRPTLSWENLKGFQELQKFLDRGSFQSSSFFKSYVAASGSYFRPAGLSI
jgi:hypothetical protein